MVCYNVAVMANGTRLYRADAPVVYRQGSLRTHLLVTILPLFVVCAFAAGYIQFRLHQITHQMPISHQENMSGESSSSNLPLTELTPQPSLQTLTVPASNNAQSATASSAAKTNNPQTTNNGNGLQQSADTRNWLHFYIKY